MTPPVLSRRGFLASTTLAGAACAVSVGAHAQGRAQVRCQYDWLMGNGQIGDIVAQSKGYFAEQGLDVTFGPGGPNAQTLPPVLSGQAQLGQLSSTSQALIAYGAERPVKVFACGYRYSPYAYISLPRSPIRTPQDLIGKTIGVNPNGRATLDLILNLHKIDPAKVHVVTMGVDMTPLVTGQVDAVTAFLTNTKAMSVLGPDIVTMTSESAGIVGYANPYFVDGEAFNGKEEMLARFLTAVAKGWGWANENRRAAVDIMCEAYPNLDRQIEYDTVDIVMKLSFDADTQKNGWGWFDDAKIARQIEILKNGNSFSKRMPDVAGVSTHAILDATARDRPLMG